MEKIVPYGLIVRFTLRKESASAFDALVYAMQERVRVEEPETLQYEMFGVVGDETARVLFETYASRAAFSFHESQAYTRVFLHERTRHLQGDPHVTELALLSPLHRIS